MDASQTFGSLGFEISVAIIVKSWIECQMFYILLVKHTVGEPNNFYI